MDKTQEREQPKPARVISIEDGRQFSQEVAVMEEELVSSMERHSAEGHEFLGLLNKDDEAISFTLYNSRIRGIGARQRITLRHSLSPNPQTKEVDVQTNNVLTIGIHTDMKTMPKVRELHEKKVGVKRIYRRETAPIEDVLSTEYYFDKDGNLAKITFIPHDIQDNRPTIKGFDYEYTRGVIGEITSLDVELVGFALTRLKESLQPHQ